VHFDRQIYAENISMFHKTYLVALKTKTIIYSWVKQSVNNLLIIRTKIFSEKKLVFLRLYIVIKWLKFQPHILHFNKNFKRPARRALLASEDDEPIKAIFECAINTLNGNHKITIYEKSNLKNKNRL